MYKIIFSVNNREEVWVLPHCPPDFPLPLAEQHHETYEGLSRDYRRIGTMGLRHMEWTALLPVHRYAFMPPESSAGFLCKAFSSPTSGGATARCLSGLSYWTVGALRG